MKSKQHYKDIVEQHKRHYHLEDILEYHVVIMLIDNIYTDIELCTCDNCSFIRKDKDISNLYTCTKGISK